MRGVARVLTFASFVPLAAGIWAMAQVPGSAPAALPDGSLLRLRGVSYGTQHQFVGGAYWQQILRPALPENLQGGDLARFSTERPALGCVFTLEEAVPGVTHRARLSAHDEHGCRIGKGQELTLTPPTDTPVPESAEGLPPHASHAALTAFPRRAKALSLRLYGSSGPEPLAEFNAAGPEETGFPAWEPAALPATARQDNLGVTLTSLTGGYSWGQLREEADPLLRTRMEQFQNVADWRQKTGEPTVQPGQVDWTLAEFRITRRGAPATEWLPRRLELADPTGNQVVYESPLPVSEDGLLRGQRADGTGFLAFPTPLCLEKPAWRLRATLGNSGSDDGVGDADFRWNVRRIPVPGRREEISLGNQATKKGVRLRLGQLLGVGGAFPETPEWDVDRPCIRIHAAPPEGESVRLTLRASDDRGRTVLCPFRGGPTPEEPEGWWYWQFVIPGGAKWLDLKFAGWRSRTLEFTVRPRRAATDLAAAR